MRLNLFTIAGLEFSLCPDEIGIMLAVLFTVLFILCAVFAGEYLERDGRRVGFYVSMLFTLLSLLGLCMAANLQTYYMFFEFLTLTSFPLILHDRTEESRKAAIKYLCYSLLGAALVLFGLFNTYAIFGDMDFQRGGKAILQGSESKALAIAFITVLGFGCKAGMMPLHDWLPTAHPQAPAPASAVLSGCVTKAGVLGILRVIFYVYGPSNLKGTWVQQTLIIISLITVFCGSMLAYKEKVLKKRLAYSTVSQLSYALFGLFLMSEAGFVGAMLQVVFHAVTKTCLFLCSGSIIHSTGIERIYSKDGKYQYTGLGKGMKLTMLGFTFAALSLTGLPPFGGFVSKWYLATGSFDAFGASGRVGAAVLLISALLTAGYLLSISSKAFFPSKDEEIINAKENGPAMTVPVMLLALSLAVLGIYSFGLNELLASVAAGLM